MEFIEGAQYELTHSYVGGEKRKFSATFIKSMAVSEKVRVYFHCKEKGEIYFNYPISAEKMYGITNVTKI